MELETYRRATWLMWLALPITAFNYWRAWDRLPERMAVHFDAAWRPNGWTTRDGSLHLALGVTVFLLIVFTFGSLVTQARKPTSIGPVLFLFYVALGLNVMMTSWMVSKNLGG
jgi:hypothetical protein